MTIHCLLSCPCSYLILTTILEVGTIRTHVLRAIHFSKPGTGAEAVISPWALAYIQQERAPGDGDLKRKELDRPPQGQGAPAIGRAAKRRMCRSTPQAGGEHQPCLASPAAISSSAETWVRNERAEPGRMRRRCGLGAPGGFVCSSASCC